MVTTLPDQSFTTILDQEKTDKRHEGYIDKQ